MKRLKAFAMIALVVLAGIALGVVVAFLTLEVLKGAGLA